MLEKRPIIKTYHKDDLALKKIFSSKKETSGSASVQQPSESPIKAVAITAEVEPTIFTFDFTLPDTSVYSKLSLDE